MKKAIEAEYKESLEKFKLQAQEDAERSNDLWFLCMVYRYPRDREEYSSWKLEVDREDNVTKVLPRLL